MATLAAGGRITLEVVEAGRDLVMTSGINNASEFDLYLDESGSFMETSKDPAERAEVEGKKRRKFPSQVAGLLVPRRRLTESKASEILEHCHTAAGWRLP